MWDMSYAIKAVKPASAKDVESFLSCHVRIPLHLLHFNHVEDNAAIWKHSCLKVGVVVIKPMFVLMTLQDNYSHVGVYFHYCPFCNKIIYYYSAM